MLAGIFRSNQPVVLSGLLLLVPLLFGPAFTRPIATPELAMPLHALLNGLVNGRPVVQGILSTLFILLVAVQVDLMVNDSELLEKRTHLSALIFPLLLAAFGPTAPLDPALTGMPFVIAALHRSWSMSNTGRAMGALFDSGMLIGIAALFYLPYLFLVVVIWTTISVLRPPQWREYLVPLIASASVLYLAWGILLITGLGDWRPLLTIAYAHVTDPAIGSVPASQRIFLCMVLAGMLPVGMLSFTRSYSRGVIRLKNIRASFLGFTAALAVLLVIIWLITDHLPAVMLVVPLTIFCANSLHGTKRSWLSESAVVSLLILALWAQWQW